MPLLSAISLLVAPRKERPLTKASTMARLVGALGCIALAAALLVRLHADMAQGHQRVLFVVASALLPKWCKESRMYLTMTSPSNTHAGLFRHIIVLNPAHNGLSAYPCFFCIRCESLTTRGCDGLSY
jgi:hypothetical protein